LIFSYQPARSGNRPPDPLSGESRGAAQSGRRLPFFQKRIITFPAGRFNSISRLSGDEKGKEPAPDCSFPVFLFIIFLRGGIPVKLSFRDAGREFCLSSLLFVNAGCLMV
jgi:hypothetical protein